MVSKQLTIVILVSLLGAFVGSVIGFLPTLSLMICGFAIRYSMNILKQAKDLSEQSKGAIA